MNTNTPSTTPVNPLNPNNVQTGQIWRDNDPRVRHLKPVKTAFEVSEIDTLFGVATCFNLANGRRRTIRLDRFRPVNSGYVKVSMTAAKALRAEVKKATR